MYHYVRHVAFCASTIFYCADFCNDFDLYISADDVLNGYWHLTGPGFSGPDSFSQKKGPWKKSTAHNITRSKRHLLQEFFLLQRKSVELF
jgi:hypothetical protein